MPSYAAQRRLPVPSQQSCCHHLHKLQLDRRPSRQCRAHTGSSWLASCQGTRRGAVSRPRIGTKAVYKSDQETYRPSGAQQRRPVTQQRPRQYSQQQPGQRQPDPYSQPWQDEKSNQYQYTNNLPSQQYRPVRQEPFQNGQRSMLRQRQRARPRYSPPPEDETILSCNQIVNKQVITRVTGNSLGNISHFFADPDTLRIVSAALRPKGLGLGSFSKGNLLLETFCQIGDVVLIHDESVLDLVPQDESVGFLDLIGCPVYTSQGDSLGKVRSYTFSPDSGKIDCIRYDALGWPAIPERLVGVWEVGVECIQEIDGLARITLLPGAEVELNRISDGPLELAFVALQKLFSGPGDDDLANQSDYELDREFEKWRLQYAPYFLKHYGQPPPASRRELDLFYQGLNGTANSLQAQAARPEARRAPAYLPPGRQSNMADVLQSSPIRETVARQPFQREDPRLRSKYPPQPRPYQSQDRQNLTREGSSPTQRLQNQQDAARSDYFYDSASHSEEAFVQQSRTQKRGSDALAQNQPANEVASVPLYDTRPPGPPSQRRDADGGYGMSEPSSQQRWQGRSQNFEDWVQPDQQMQPSYAGPHNPRQAQDSGMLQGQRTPPKGGSSYGQQEAFQVETPESRQESWSTASEPLEAVEGSLGIQRQFSQQVRPNGQQIAGPTMSAATKQQDSRESGSDVGQVSQQNSGVQNGQSERQQDSRNHPAPPAEEADSHPPHIRQPPEPTPPVTQKSSVMPSKSAAEEGIQRTNQNSLPSDRTPAGSQNGLYQQSQANETFWDKQVY